MNTSLLNFNRLSHMFGADSRNVSRDPTLLFAILISIVPNIVVIIWYDAINQAVLDNFGLADVLTYAMPMILCLPAFLVGWVTGFLFLDDRDDGTLLSVDVTPVGKQGFIAYRAGATISITFLITFVTAEFLLAEQPAALRALIAVLIGIEAVAAAFILPALARNKVEGLALTKLTNIGAIIPLVAIIPSPFRYVAGIVPTYWIGELLGVSSQNYLPTPVVVTLAVVTHVGAAWVLYKLISRRIG